MVSIANFLPTVAHRAFGISDFLREYTIIFAPVRSTVLRTSVLTAVSFSQKFLGSTTLATILTRANLAQ